MKSKAEIVEALKYHMSGDCSECSYREGWHTCNLTPERGLFADILALLNKSDFEVLSEIISRTKRFDFECHEGPKGLMLIKLQNPAARDCLPVNIRFDKEGNIL